MTKHAHENELPTFCTSDVNDSCVIYQLKDSIRAMHSIEALYQAVKVVHYDGTDAIVEDPKGDQAKAMFLELRSGSLLPESNEGYDLTWYDEDGLDLDAIITMCAI